MAAANSALDSNDIIRVSRVDSAGIGSKEGVYPCAVVEAGYNGSAVGSTVTQITSRTTGVTINTMCGNITLA